MNAPEPRGSLRLHVSTDPTTINITLWGTADSASYAELHDALSRCDPSPAHTVHLDLDQLSYCDIRSCALLLQFVADATRKCSMIRITGEHPPISQLLVEMDRDDQAVT
jgi:anti-anti-sigma regulatory factor